MQRHNVTGTPPPYTATSNGTGGFETGDPSSFDLSSHTNLLVNGTNTLAIQLVNASLSGSSDAALLPELTNVGSAPYTAIRSVKPANGLSHSLHLTLILDWSTDDFVTVTSNKRADRPVRPSGSL